MTCKTAVESVRVTWLDVFLDAWLVEVHENSGLFRLTSSICMDRHYTPSELADCLEG